ncbi:uncharacterized protein TNCV_2841191 [Trichonephila clavipes]|uniref:DUF382 domain-containing protein n=1 Tax=Trichonephila clavipes TaxID=2585209 RepID=A0A8X6V934_TRICX|nr:uncharacterized protein TNCV_2841191 [Trichonephila clavipes]
MRDIEMEFETQKKLIELEGKGHFTRACLDTEVSIDRGNSGNEVRSILAVRPNSRLKWRIDSRLMRKPKLWMKGGRWKEERRMNEIIALEEEMRLKNERWLVEEQMRHVQEEHETSMKEQKCLPERCEQVQTHSADEYAVAQSVDVIKDKGDLNPVILSNERMDFDEDEIEEEKPKLPKRKSKNLSRRTVAELQQKVNLKASSNMVLIPQHWSLRREYSQDKSGIGKLAWKLTDFIKRYGTVKIRRSSRENRSTRKRVRLKLRPQDNIYRDGKVRGETRHLDFKIVDPAWMKKGVARGAAIEKRRLGAERGLEGKKRRGGSDQRGGAIGHGRMSGIVGDDLNKMVLTT